MVRSDNMNMIDLAINYNKEKQRRMRRREQTFKKHAKRNRAIEMCKKLGLHWKANDNTIYICEWCQTFTHSQTGELIRRLQSLDAYQ